MRTTTMMNVNEFCNQSTEQMQEQYNAYIEAVKYIAHLKQISEHEVRDPKYDELVGSHMLQCKCITEYNVSAIIAYGFLIAKIDNNAVQCRDAQTEKH